MAGTVRNKLLELIQKKEREEGRRIKISELSRESGVPRATIYFWTENPHLTQFHSGTVAQFCAYFDCELSDLLELEPEGTNG